MFDASKAEQAKDCFTSARVDLQNVGTETSKLTLIKKSLRLSNTKHLDLSVETIVRQT